jgi:hypothetical protein
MNSICEKCITSALNLAGQKAHDQMAKDSHAASLDRGPVISANSATATAKLAGCEANGSSAVTVELNVPGILLGTSNLEIDLNITGTCPAELKPDAIYSNYEINYIRRWDPPNIIFRAKSQTE